MLTAGLPWWVRLLLWFAEPLPDSQRRMYVVRVAHTIVVVDECTKPGNDFDWKAECSCGWEGTRQREAEADFEGHRHRTQAFFADIAHEMRRPSFGEMAASTMQALLNRAQEAQLYTPEKR